MKTCYEVNTAIKELEWRKRTYKNVVLHWYKEAGGLEEPEDMKEHNLPKYNTVSSINILFSKEEADELVAYLRNNNDWEWIDIERYEIEDETKYLLSYPDYGIGSKEGFITLTDFKIREYKVSAYFSITGCDYIGNTYECWSCSAKFEPKETNIIHKDFWHCEDCIKKHEIEHQKIIEEKNKLAFVKSGQFR